MYFCCVILIFVDATTQQNIGESSSGRMAVSKTAHGGSNPSSPANEGIYQEVYSFFDLYEYKNYFTKEKLWTNIVP